MASFACLLQMALYGDRHKRARHDDPGLVSAGRALQGRWRTMAVRIESAGPLGSDGRGEAASGRQPAPTPPACCYRVCVSPAEGAHTSWSRPNRPGARPSNIRPPSEHGARTGRKASTGRNRDEPGIKKKTWTGKNTRSGWVGAPPGTRSPNPRIKPSHRGWSRWRENLARGCGLAAGRGRCRSVGGWLRGLGVWVARMGAGCPCPRRICGMRARDLAWRRDLTLRVASCCLEHAGQYSRR